VIAFGASWYLHMGESPMWNTVVGTEADNCRRNWWINLLYLNNYFGVEQMVSFSLLAMYGFAVNWWRVTYASSNHSSLPVK
jgi:hypothetical protein